MADAQLSTEFSEYLQQMYGKDGITVQVEDGRPLEQARVIDLWEVLPQAFGYSKSQAKRLLTQGAIKVWDDATRDTPTTVRDRYLLAELPLGVASGKHNFRRFE